MHDARLIYGARHMKFFVSVVDRSLAMQDPHEWHSPLPKAIYPADRLPLLIENPKFLQDHNMVCRHEVQAGSPKGWCEDKGGRGVDCGELVNQGVPRFRAGNVCMEDKWP